MKIIIGSGGLALMMSVMIKTLFVLFILSAPVGAQYPPTYGRPSSIERDARYRDWVLDRLKQSKKMSADQQRLAYEQLKKDFENLQVANNDLWRASSSADVSLNYELIFRKSAEIQKTALSLRANLMLPDPPAAKGGQHNPDEIPVKILLSALDGLIVKFVKNPIFKNVEVIDTKAAATARRDLESIISVSEKLKKRIEKENRAVNR